MSFPQLIARAVAPALFASLLACSSSEAQMYTTTGVVEDVAPDGRWVKISHDDIPGFMPAMTMNFDVADAAVVAGVKSGSVIRFQLERTATTLRVTALEVIGERPPPAGASSGAELSDAAPPFELTDHTGAAFRLADTRGKAVLLDFVFTRCPGPCPILTAAHARLQKQLPAEVASRVHFVSISIDPTFDTPERLTEYALARGADLRSWSFLTGEAEAVDAIIAAYHVGTRVADDGTLDHLVATFLIDPAGNIAERFIGLEHESGAILGAIQRVLQ